MGFFLIITATATSDNFFYQNIAKTALSTKLIGLLVIIISPFMYLTGISLEMNIFHLVVSMLAHISGSECPIFTLLVSLDRFWVAECPSCRIKTRLGLWPTPDLKISHFRTCMKYPIDFSHR